MINDFTNLYDSMRQAKEASDVVSTKIKRFHDQYGKALESVEDDTIEFYSVQRTEDAGLSPKKIALHQYLNILTENYKKIKKNIKFEKIDVPQGSFAFQLSRIKTKSFETKLALEAVAFKIPNADHMRATTTRYQYIFLNLRDGDNMTFLSIHIPPNPTLVPREPGSSPRTNRQNPIQNNMSPLLRIRTTPPKNNRELDSSDWRLPNYSTIKPPEIPDVETPSQPSNFPCDGGFMPEAWFEVGLDDSSRDFLTQLVNKITDGMTQANLTHNIRLTPPQFLGKIIDWVISVPSQLKDLVVGFIKMVLYMLPERISKTLLDVVDFFSPGLIPRDTNSMEGTEGVQAEAGPGAYVPEAGLGIEAFFGALYAQTFYKYVREGSWKLFIESVSHASKDSKDASRSLDFCIKMLREVAMLIDSIFGLDLMSHFDDPEIKKFSKRLKELEATFRTSSYDQYKFSVDIFSLYHEIETFYLRGGSRMENWVRDRLVYLLNKMKPVVRYCEQNINPYNGPRVEPLAILLAGPTGSGKSTITVPFLYALMGNILEGEDKEGFLKNANDFLFFRANENEYWDGYKNRNMAIVYDDFGQQRDTAGNPNPDAFEIIRLKNTAPYHLHYAAIEDKQKNFANPRVIYATSNQTALKFESIHCMEAVVRRFDLAFLQVPKASFCKDGYSTRPMDRRLDLGKVRKNFPFDPDNPATFARLDVIEFIEWDFMRGEPLPGGRVLNFDQLLQIAISKYKELNRKGDMMLKFHEMMKTYDPTVPIVLKEMEGQALCSGSFDGLSQDAIETFLAEDEFSRRLVPEVAPALETTPGGSNHRLREDAPASSDPSASAPYRPVEEDWASASESLDEASSLHEAPIRVREGDWPRNLWPGVHRVEASTFFRITTTDANFGPDNNGCRMPGCVRDFFHSIEGVFDFKYLGVGASKVLSLFGIDMSAETGATILKALSSAVLGLTIACGVLRELRSIYYWLFPRWGHESNVNRRDVVRRGAKAKRTNRKTNRRVRVEKLHPEAALLDTEVYMSILKRNMYIFQAGERELGYALFVGPHHFVVPRHFMEMIEDEAADLDEYPLTFRDIITGRVHFVLNFWDDVPWKESEDENCDVAFCFVKNSKVRAHKTLTKYLLSAKDKKADGNNYDAQLAVSRGESLLFLQIHLTYGRNFSYNDGSNLSSRELNYSAPTRRGDCGSMILIQDTRFPSPVIAGFHCGGLEKNGYKPCVGVSLYKEEVESFINEDFDEDCSFNFDESIEVRVVPEAETKIRDFTVLHIAKQPHVGGDSKIVNSVLKPYLWPLKTAPARLRPFVSGFETIDPLALSRLGYAHDEVMLNGNALDVCTHNVGSMILATYRDPPHLPRVFSFEEAVAGIDGLEFVDAVCRTTSPGYPWILSRGSYVGKSKWLGKEGSSLDGSHISELREAVTNIVERARNGVRLEHIFMDFLKDERRPLEKVAIGKTRQIMGCPMDLLVAMKMYFGDFVRHVMDNRIFNGVAVGIDPGTEWDTLARYLKVSPDNVFTAGDYSKYDARIPVAIGLRVYKIIKSFYVGSTDEEDRIRYVLFQEIINSVHLSDGVVYTFTGGNPSGQPMTAIYNSIANLLIMQYVGLSTFLSNGGKGEEWCAIAERTRFSTFGDDVIVSYHPTDSYIWAQSVLEVQIPKLVGMAYTNEAKDGLSKDARSIEEITFLKRGFRKHLGLWTCPLDLDVLRETLSWVKKDNTEDELKLRIEAVLCELARHGKRVFSEHASKIIKAAGAALGYYPRNSTYENALIGEVCLGVD